MQTCRSIFASSKGSLTIVVVLELIVISTPLTSRWIDHLEKPGVPYHIAICVEQNDYELARNLEQSKTPQC